MASDQASRRAYDSSCVYVRTATWSGDAATMALNAAGIVVSHTSIGTVAIGRSEERNVVGGRSDPRNRQHPPRSWPVNSRQRRPAALTCVVVRDPACNRVIVFR